MKKIYVVLITALVALATSMAMAEVDTTRLNRLNGVSVYGDSDEARVVIRFEQDLAQVSKPRLFENFIQIDFNGSYVAPAEKSYILSDPLVSFAAAHQLDDDTVRLKIFLSEDARGYADRWNKKVASELLVIAIKKKATTPTTVQPFNLVIRRTLGYRNLNFDGVGCRAVLTGSKLSLKLIVPGLLALPSTRISQSSDQ